MFEISVKTHFSAAHRLVGYDGSCANPHGHNWEVAIHIRGPALDDIGILVDFREIKAALRDILGGLDHCDLNALPAFAAQNPTSENLAQLLYRGLAERLNNARYRIQRVDVSESPGTSAGYWEDGNS